MKRKSSSNRNILPRQLVVLTFLFIFVAGIFGVTTVGLRQQIAKSGDEARQMERRMVEIDRHLSRYAGELAIAVSPAQLEAYNQYLQLGLRAPREDQIIRVNAESQIQFAQQRWQQSVSVPEETLSFFAPVNN